tara:strand:+ start:1212 stop:1391 length:180 start_codon:yes stop_codon:yes gene_type:complete
MERKVLKVGDLVSNQLAIGKPEYIIGIVVKEIGINGFIAVLWRDGKIRHHLRSALKWVA